MISPQETEVVSTDGWLLFLWGLLFFFLGVMWPTRYPLTGTGSGLRCRNSLFFFFFFFFLGSVASFFIYINPLSASLCVVKIWSRGPDPNNSIILIPHHAQSSLNLIPPKPRRAGGATAALSLSFSFLYVLFVLSTDFNEWGYLAYSRPIKK